MKADLHVFEVTERDYATVFAQMKAFTEARTPDTPDELWLVEHDPVFTLGLAGQPAHVLAAGDIPVVHSNRGGQVTYHGPGQVVVYPLINLQRRGYFVKEYIYKLEEAVIQTLIEFGITGHRVADAPGVYVRLSDPQSHALLPQRPMKREPVEQLLIPHQSESDSNFSGAKSAIPSPDFTDLGKIAAVGVKVSRHCTYHGVSLNVDMDLSAYDRINPCGYAGLKTVDLKSLGVQTHWANVAQRLAQHLTRLL